MGELDKFVGKGVSKGTSTSVTTTGSQLPSWAQSNQTTPSSAAQTILQGSAARFAIALDATGSMGPLIEMAKKSIGRILQRVISRAGRPVEIKIIVYRDYDVPNELVATSETTKDAQSLIAWLGKVHVSGGGANEGEAVESALEAIMQAGKFDAVLLAGDEPSNDRQQIRAGCGKNSPSAADLAGLFAQTGTPIHTFVVGNRPSTIKDFATLAKISGGKSGRLDGSNEMIDMAVMAMLAKLKGSSGVREYMKDYQLTSKAAEFGQLFLEGPKK